MTMHRRVNELRESVLDRMNRHPDEIPDDTTQCLQHMETAAMLKGALLALDWVSGVSEQADVEQLLFGVADPNVVDRLARK